MTLAECRKLKKGDQVYINLGNGWTQTMIFIKMVKVTSYGKMTFSDLAKGNFDFSNGREEWWAECEYKNDYGRVIKTERRPRALHKEVRG